MSNLNWVRIFEVTDFVSISLNWHFSMVLSCRKLRNIQNSMELRKLCEQHLQFNRFLRFFWCCCWQKASISDTYRYNDYQQVVEMSRVEKCKRDTGEWKWNKDWEIEKIGELRETQCVNEHSYSNHSVLLTKTVLEIVQKLTQVHFYLKLNWLGQRRAKKKTFFFVCELFYLTSFLQSYRFTSQSGCKTSNEVQQILSNHFCVNIFGISIYTEYMLANEHFIPRGCQVIIFAKCLV